MTLTMDLTKEQPRPMDATLAGYTWLPRMIDKARASRAGTLGEYFRYPCPIDRACLAHLGVDAERFADLAVSAPSDDAVVDGLKQLGVPDADQVEFDPIALNEELHSNGS